MVIRLIKQISVSRNEVNSKKRRNYQTAIQGKVNTTKTSNKPNMTQMRRTKVNKRKHCGNDEGHHKVLMAVAVLYGPDPQNVMRSIV